MCEVHHCPMRIEESQVGLAQLPTSFLDDSRTRFPHPGHFRAISEYVGWYDIVSIRAPVCPECTKARAEWDKEYRKKLYGQ